MFLGGLRGALAYTMIISYSGDYSDMFVDTTLLTQDSTLEMIINSPALVESSYYYSHRVFRLVNSDTVCGGRVQCTES